VTVGWQDQVRKCTDEQDWTAAMQIIDHEISRAPQDTEIRFWRARVLLWSGRFEDAEHEYLAILSAAPTDPDYWMGLANVYSRENRTEEEMEALDRALALDPRRADIHLARGRALRATHNSADARLEFRKALDLDPANQEARNGLRSLQSDPKHELRLGTNTDLFSFASPNYDQGLSLTSQWTHRWRTTATGSFYRWAGIDAEKFSASVTGKLPRWGALEVGGATANDNAVIPKKEAFISYDQGWKFGRSKWVGGLETVCGQHWYWYSTAGILTMNEMTIFYLPRDWTWSLGLIEARSHFFGTGTEWRLSGITKLGFPIAGHDEQRLGGGLFFAAGTENFAQLDQIGRFSSQTYGGSLKLQLTARQNVTGVGAYQKRTQDRSETSFGFTYGIRF
jgi:tetratricopeptide (TPR) repeat protein